MSSDSFFDPLTPQQAEEVASLMAMPDDAIDTSDIPELRDWSNPAIGVSRPSPTPRSTRQAD